MSSPALAASAPERTSATATRDSADLVAARALVKALDTYQLDPILGLFLPGLGDLVTSVVGAFLVVVAARRGVAPIVIARMLLNLTVDAAVGAVPLVGDVADVAVRANRKNLVLLEERRERGKASWKDWAAVIGAAVLCIGMFAFVIWLFVKVLGAIF